jgi:hypothetical protein
MSREADGGTITGSTGLPEAPAAAH